jgi:molecular chaperone DnaK
MSWWRTVRFWLAGGKRRWFARTAKRLPAAIRATTTPALAGQLVELISVGLEVDGERALAVVVACDPQLTATVVQPELASAVQAVLARAARLATGPAWRIGWLLGKRLDDPAPRRSFGAGLALHLARGGEPDSLVLHLDECRALGVLDRGLLAEVEAAVATHPRLQHDASWLLCRSCCHEQLGDLMTALRVCPAAEGRRLHLIERLERSALDLAARGDARGAMTTLVELRTILASERDPSPAWLERIGVLERHRTELLVASRAALRADLDRQAPAHDAARRREAILACAAFEELASEWAEAALLLEQAGELADRLRASQLWEQDERYGEAVRALGPLSDRAEVQLRMASLRETGGDAAGAATLFEHLKKWADAQRAHEAAGHWMEAARCYRQTHGALAAARSSDYARLLVQAQRVDELLQLQIEQLDQLPRDRAVLDRLRALYRDHESQIGSPHLREAGARHLADGVDVGLRDAFDRAVDGWIAQARTETERRYGRVWGMDLGTSKSAVAVFDLEQGAAVICPHHGQPHFPSTLALDKHGNELVGLSALDQLRPDLRGCIESSKRAMGTRRVYRIGDRHFSPEEVAARLLTHGRGLAEAFLRDRVHQRVMTLARAALGDACDAAWLDGKTAKLGFSLPEAVVTIPAYFNFDQRRATRDAAEIAGIKVLRLIPEPTAACLSAGLARQLPGKLMVVDLGAGTLDLTYLEASYHDKNEGFFEVEQIFGDSQFGSCDFDAVIEKLFVDRLNQAGLELRGIDRRRLHAAAEQLKIALSSSPTASDELIAFAGQPRYTLELTAARLEQLLEPLLARLEATCRQAAGLRMDHLVLVGGPMFSPLVRRRIEKLFARKADAVVDPRTAVAMGAACQGALLSNHAQVPFLLLDIVPFALGVLAKEDKAAAERITFHIPRGTRIPHDNARPYSTIDDNQTGVDVQVFQGVGDSTDPAANNRLAVVHLDGIPAAKAGEPKITILFRIDANGLLEVTAKDETTGKSKSLRIEDATWLSPSERSDMTRRLTEGQRWARARAELTTLAQQVTAIADKLRDLERRDASQAWQRQFAAWQGAGHAQPPGLLDPADELALAGMYNAGQTTCDRAQLGLDRARNLRPRHDRFVQATTTLDFSSSATAEKQADLEKQLAELQDQGRQLEAQLRDTLATLEPLELQFRQWSAILARASATRADPRERFAIHHDAGDWQSALDTYPQAFAALAAADVPLSIIHRRLDGLARLGRRDAYRQVLAEQRERLALRDLQLDTLNEFGRHVSPAIAWVFSSGLGTGSGFLVGPDLVVTNRHVVTEQGPVPVANLAVQVGGTRRAVTHLRFPPNAEIDLAILQLAEPLDARPVRVGYSGLVEIGERVLAIGFPLPEGDSFDENLLLDHGIVNRIRTRPDRHGRELELGLRISPGMSGGPIFNDRGEVIAVSTFVRYQTTSGGAQPTILDRSSHAIAVDALHDLLPRPWTT